MSKGDIGRGVEDHRLYWGRFCSLSQTSERIGSHFIYTSSDLTLIMPTEIASPKEICVVPRPSSKLRPTSEASECLAVGWVRMACSRCAASTGQSTFWAEMATRN